VVFIHAINSPTCLQLPVVFNPPICLWSSSTLITRLPARGVHPAYLPVVFIPPIRLSSSRLSTCGVHPRNKLAYLPASACVIQPTYLAVVFIYAINSPIRLWCSSAYLPAVFTRLSLWSSPRQSACGVHPPIYLWSSSRQ
jgi:hypothetical protein